MGFSSPEEEARYCAAVRAYPKFPHEQPLNYAARIGALINGEDVPKWLAERMEREAAALGSVGSEPVRSETVDEERAAIRAADGVPEIRLPYRERD
jgi:hypothetical protein